MAHTNIITQKISKKKTHTHKIHANMQECKKKKKNTHDSHKKRQNKHGRHTNIIKHENTQKVKQDGSKTQDKMRMGLRLDIKQGKA